jgi:hypothetical protein
LQAFWPVDLNEAAAKLKGNSVVCQITCPLVLPVGPDRQAQAVPTGLVGKRGGEWLMSLPAELTGLKVSSNLRRFP